VTPLPESQFFHQYQAPKAPLINISQPSLTTRLFRSLANIDDETMRRIALLPYMVSGYFQLMFNIALPAFFLYWVYSFGLTIQSDVEKKVQLFSEEVMEQIAKCSRDYRENRCDPATRVPALISACQAWEECMARDPHLVAKRSGISAEIFGETLNSFFNVLSWKSIISLVLLVIGVAAIFNFTFSMTRKEGNRRVTESMDSVDYNDNMRMKKSPRPAQLMNTPRRRRY
jgi:disulfide bond formation protein DsbB